MKTTIIMIYMATAEWLELLLFLNSPKKFMFIVKFIEDFLVHFKQHLFFSKLFKNY